MDASTTTTTTTIKITDKYIIKTINEIINQSQDSFYDGDEGIDTIKNLLKIDNPEINVVLIFIKTFINCMENALIIALNHQHSNKIDNVIDFMAKFCYESIILAKTDSLYNLIWQNIANKALDYSNAKTDCVRYRICQLFNKIFKYHIKDNVGLDIDQKLYVKLQTCLLERIRDVNEQVQLEAIQVIQYLQNPDDNECQVINGFLYLLKQNNQFLKAKLKLLEVIALTKQSYLVIRELIYENNRDLRCLCYRLLINKVPIKHLCADEFIVRLVKKLIAEKEDELLTTFLRNKHDLLNNNFSKLFSALNISKYSEEELLTLLDYFNTLFDDFSCFDYEKLFVIHNNLNKNYVNICEFNRISAFYYRALLHFYKYKNFDLIQNQLFNFEHNDLLQQIRLFISQKVQPNFDDTAKFNDSLYVLKQLFHCLTYYKSCFDEEFVQRLIQTIMDIIYELDVFNESLLSLLMRQIFLNVNEEDPGEYTRLLLRVINKLEDINSESETDSQSNPSQTSIVKQQYILLIVCEILANPIIKRINALIDSKLQDIILPNISNKEPGIRMYAVRALGLCCLLSIDLSISYLFLFEKIINVDQVDVVIEAQKALFNIFLCFDLCNSNQTIRSSDDGIDSTLDSTCTTIDNNNNVSGNDEDYRLFLTRIAKSLQNLLNHKNDEIKYISCEGFAKLLIAGRTSNAELLAKLMLKRFDPESTPKIRSCLIKFFYCFSFEMKKANLVENIVLPTIEFLSNVPGTSHFSKIDLKELAKYICYLTYDKNLEVHDNVIISILNQFIAEKIGKKNRNNEFCDHLIQFLLDFYENELLVGRSFRSLLNICNLSQQIMDHYKTNKLKIHPEFKDFVSTMKHNCLHHSEYRTLKRKGLNMTDSDESDGENDTEDNQASKRAKINQ